MEYFNCTTWTQFDHVKLHVLLIFYFPSLPSQRQTNHRIPEKAIKPIDLIEEFQTWPSSLLIALEATISSESQAVSCSCRFCFDTRKGKKSIWYSWDGRKPDEAINNERKWWSQDNEALTVSLNRRKAASSLNMSLECHSRMMNRILQIKISP